MDKHARLQVGPSLDADNHLRTRPRSQATPHAAATALRHETEDDTQLYPAIEQALGGDAPIAALHRTHREVRQLDALLARMSTDLPDEGPGQAAANDFRRVLYGLDAIMRLHFAQENELYHSLANTERTKHPPGNRAFHPE